MTNSKTVVHAHSFDSCGFRNSMDLLESLQRSYLNKSKRIETNIIDHVVCQNMFECVNVRILSLVKDKINLHRFIEPFCNRVSHHNTFACKRPMMNEK